MKLLKQWWLIPCTSVWLVTPSRPEMVVSQCVAESLSLPSFSLSMTSATQMPSGLARQNVSGDTGSVDGSYWKRLRQKLLRMLATETYIDLVVGNKLFIGTVIWPTITRIHRAVTQKWLHWWYSNAVQAPGRTALIESAVAVPHDCRDTSSIARPIEQPT